MMRHCDGKDKYLVKPYNAPQGKVYVPCDCELEFDDVEYSTVWPHDYIPSRAEKDATMAEILNFMDSICE